MIFNNKQRLRPTHIREEKMKKISKIMLCLGLSIMGFDTVKAQSDYLLNYGPGSPAWCWQMQQQQNAMSMQNAMMRAQIMNYCNQQATAATQHLMNNPFQPMPGVVTYDGAYVTPQNVNNYHKEQVDCEHCNGGYNYSTVYLGGNHTKQVKRICVFCHGNGTVTKTVMDD